MVRSLQCKEVTRCMKQKIRNQNKNCNKILIILYYFNKYCSDICIYVAFFMNYHSICKDISSHSKNINQKTGIFQE